MAALFNMYMYASNTVLGRLILLHLYMIELIHVWCMLHQCIGSAHIATLVYDRACTCMMYASSVYWVGSYCYTCIWSSLYMYDVCINNVLGRLILLHLYMIELVHVWCMHQQCTGSAHIATLVNDRACTCMMCASSTYWVGSYW